MVSRPLLAAMYRQKLTEMAALGAEVTAIVPACWRDGTSLQKLEKDHEGPYELVSSPLRWNGRFHVHYFPELSRLIRRYNPDVIHMDEEPYNLSTYLGVRAATRAHLPSLFFTWQNICRRYPPPFSHLEQKVYARTKHAIAGSREAASVLQAKGYSKGVTVAPQFGVDPAVFSPGPQVSDVFTVGFLNRLVPPKAPMLALEAFRRLPPDSRLLVVGDGPLHRQLLATIDAWSLRDRVDLITRIPSVAMPDMIRSLHTVVLPSLTTPSWKEQFGRVLVEAMSCGVPVVGSSSGEIPEVIGDAGLIVREGDVDALAAALYRLYESPSLREDLAHRGRDRVLQHYTHARIARLTMDAYRRTLEH